MILQQEDKNALVTIRLQRAKETLAEVQGNIDLGYWRVAANRLYYACYYAASALLIKHGLIAHTHAGVINQLGLHFVKNGKVSMEQGKLLKQLFALRQSGDYDDWMIIEEKDIIPLLVPAKQFIETIEQLINENEMLLHSQS
jgi:uncharacterized protein (UPF0332 family)